MDPEDEYPILGVAGERKKSGEEKFSHLCGPMVNDLFSELNSLCHLLRIKLYPVSCHLSFSSVHKE